MCVYACVCVCVCGWVCVCVGVGVCGWVSGNGREGEGAGERDVIMCVWGCSV